MDDPFQATPIDRPIVLNLKTIEDSEVCEFEDLKTWCQWPNLIKVTVVVEYCCDSQSYS